MDYLRWLFTPQTPSIPQIPKQKIVDIDKVTFDYDKPYTIDSLVTFERYRQFYKNRLEEIEKHYHYRYLKGIEFDKHGESITSGIHSESITSGIHSENTIILDNILNQITNLANNDCVKFIKGKYELDYDTVFYDKAYGTKTEPMKYHGVQIDCHKLYGVKKPEESS